MWRTWVLLPILPLALACSDAAPTATTALIDVPIPVPLPVPVRLDLGTLGGASSYANDISGDGTVVGKADNAAGQRRAFRWTPLGGMTDLGTLPGDDWSEAISITDDGRILGVSGSSSVSLSQGTTVIWSADGTITAVAIPPTDAAYVSVSDFNARGEVIGSETFATQHAWIWSEAQGKYDITSGAGSREGGASEVNEDGWVTGTNDAVGEAWTCVRTRPRCWHTFVYSYDAGYRDIGTPGDDPDATLQGMGIGAGPTVVGGTSALGGRAYRWTESEGFTILPSLSSAYATSVNSGGMAVGVAFDPALGAQATAWPRSGGSIRLSPDDPNTQIATAVNDMGMVVGWSAQSGGGNHATLWVLGPASELLASRAARAPAASVARLSPAATAAALAVNACMSDVDALLSRGALLACENWTR